MIEPMFSRTRGSDRRLGVMTDEEWDNWVVNNATQWTSALAAQRRLRLRIGAMALMHAIAEAVAAVFGGNDEQ